MRAARANPIPFNYRAAGVLVDHDRIVSALDSDRIVLYLHAIRGYRITDKGDRFIIAIVSIITPKTSGAGARISPVAVVVNVVVLDGNPWLGQSREDNAPTRGVAYFKAIDGDIGIRRLTRSTRAYNAILPAGTTIDDR